MRLDRYSVGSFDRGRPIWVEALWQVVSALSVASFLPGSAFRVAVLRLFGARIGAGVVIKPFVQVKFPWRLKIGDHTWIGERVWIDNLAQVRVGSHACISQGAYLCTGSHDWGRETFDLISREIVIADHTWIGAMTNVAPGASIEEGAVLTMGSVARGRLTGWTIYRGNPAEAVRIRPH